VTGRPDVIFRLAAVVSGEAEDDLENGYRVNLDATRMLLDAIRACDRGYPLRVVYSSSIAVFRPPCRMSSAMTTASRLPPATARRRR